MHLAPNATRIIKALGGDLNKYGAPNVKMFKAFQPDGTPILAMPSGTDDDQNQWVSTPSWWMGTTFVSSD